MHNDEHHSSNNHHSRRVPGPHSAQTTRPARRFLIDYVGGETYQLSLQDCINAPLPIAKARDPRPLFLRAVDSADVGDEIVVAPLVSLLHVCSLPTGLLRLLADNNADPFDTVGEIFRVPAALVGRRRKRSTHKRRCSKRGQQGGSREDSKKDPHRGPQEG